MFRFCLISLLCFALTLSGCSIERGGEMEPATAERVLLAYVGGDNNLSGEAAEKVAALAAGWNGRACQKVVIYTDIKGSAPQLLEVVKGSGGGSGSGSGANTTRVVASYSSENSASAAVLSRVIADVRAQYPAQSYGLLVFSHASGWLPSGRLSKPVQAGDEARIAEMQTASSLFAAPVPPNGGPRGFTEADNSTETTAPAAYACGTAESNNTSTYSTRSIIVDGSSEMELSDLAAAIPDGAFDYIVFEACYMAGVEVAWELRRKADYILASSAEIVAPGFTAIYPSATSNLLSADPGAFGRAAFNSTLTYGRGDYRRSATYSLVRTAGLEPLAAFIRQNCDFTKAPAINDVQHFDRTGSGMSGALLFFDFGDYYSRLLSRWSQTEELSRLLNDCIAWKASTDTFMPTYGGFSIDSHSGLTTYIPQSSYPYLNARYAQLGWAKAIALAP